MGDSRYGRALQSIAMVFVLTGGGILLAMSLLVVVSILGRWLFSRPVPGDFEIVAMGTAISAFLTLPYCHLKRSTSRSTSFSRTPSSVPGNARWSCGRALRNHCRVVLMAHVAGPSRRVALRGRHDDPQYAGLAGLPFCGHLLRSPRDQLCLHGLPRFHQNPS